MKPPGSYPDSGDAGEALLLQLYRSAGPAAKTALLRRLGREGLLRQPIVDWMHAPDERELLASGERSRWVDFQLLEASPKQEVLDAQGIGKYELLSEAWPDGFDRILFSDGAHDTQHAEEIFAIVVEQAGETPLVVRSEEGEHEGDFREVLVGQFVAFIRRWRKQVVERLSGAM